MRRHFLLKWVCSFCTIFFSSFLCGMDIVPKELVTTIVHNCSFVEVCRLKCVSTALNKWAQFADMQLVCYDNEKEYIVLTDGLIYAAQKHNSTLFKALMSRQDDIAKTKRNIELTHMGYNNFSLSNQMKAYRGEVMGIPSKHKKLLQRKLLANLSQHFPMPYVSSNVCKMIAANLTSCMIPSNQEKCSLDQPIHYMYRFSYDKGLLAALIKKSDINARDKDGNTPLHRTAVAFKCSYKGIDISFFKMLIDNGVDVNACNNKGQTPLHLLVGSRSDVSGIIDLFLRNGTDVLIRDNEERNVYDCALPAWKRFVKTDGIWAIERRIGAQIFGLCVAGGMLWYIFNLIVNCPSSEKC
jgi:hypothetical protein